jgi:hypothetical protein
LALALPSGGVGLFKLNQHNHFSLPTVLNTLAHTPASFFMAIGVGVGSYQQSKKISPNKKLPDTTLFNLALFLWPLAFGYLSR